jgi:oxygen-independent coproporphyrinogen-3 oxidase
VSAEFIYAVPDQSLEEWCEDLGAIAGLGVPHLSLYNLTVEPETPLAGWVRRGQVVLPPDEVQAEMMLEARRRLGAVGFDHYEVSSFARPGHRAVHNSLYWKGGEYLGLGAGAHGFVRVGAGGVRWADVDPPEEYMGRLAAGELPEAFREERSPSELALELVMTGLRWLDGLEFDELVCRGGWDLRQSHPEVLEGLCQEGLAEVSHLGMRLTEQGLLLLNNVILRFFPERGRGRSSAATLAQKTCAS